MVTNGPPAALGARDDELFSPGVSAMVTVTVLGVVLLSVKMGAASGPSVSHCVTPCGTVKSSTMTGALWLPGSSVGSLALEVAPRPTPWLAKARQMIA